MLAWPNLRGIESLTDCDLDLCHELVYVIIVAKGEPTHGPLRIDGCSVVSAGRSKFVTVNPIVVQVSWEMMSVIFQNSSFFTHVDQDHLPLYLPELAADYQLSRSRAKCRCRDHWFAQGGGCT